MSPIKRLTRSAPDTVKAQEFALRQEQSRATTRKSGVGRELAALGIEVGGETQRTTNRRYDLRRGPRDVLAPKPARVTKAKGSTGRKKKAENVYLGPGYQQQGAREGTAEDARECLICAETLSDAQFPGPETMAECNHETRVCRPCIARYVETQLQANGQWTGLQCLDCQGNLSKDQIWNQIWLDDFERLQELVARKKREAHPRYRSCLSCDNGQIHYSYLNPVVTCKHCGSRSCFNHRIPWHDDYSCDDYDDSHPAAKSTRTSEERLRSMAKKCPGKDCSYYIEKDGGCPNMYCSQCHQTWVWDKVKYGVKPTAIYKAKR